MTRNISPAIPDPSDTNNFNTELYQQLFENLPSGWTRIPPPQLKPGQPPYIHEHSGETSFRNPNYAKIMATINSNNNSSSRMDPTKKAQVKKLRLLLQAGAPLGAVKQKAELEGVDMDLVLSPSNEGVNGKEKNEGVSIPETLIKKYKRMLKAGLPMDRIQQLAGIEAGVDPGVVERVLNADTSKHGSSGNDEQFVKFVQMQKAGVPVAAVLNSARIQGVDVEALKRVLGAETQTDAVHDEKKEEEDEPPIASKKMNILDFHLAHASEIIKDCLETEEVHFTPLGTNVSFPTKRPLTDLVRKMAQTVQKTSRFNSNSSNEMVVDVQTLYHALGALKGVQYAQSEYNSTFSKCHDAELIRAKRYAFVEMARSIGMVLNENKDIPGLNELISFIESHHNQEINNATTLLQDGYYDFNSLSTMYPPGQLVIAKHAAGGTDCLAQVQWNRYTQGKTIMGKPMRYFELCVMFVVALGGGQCGFAEVVQGMEMFEGTRSLKASALGLGLAFLPVGDDQRDEVLERFKHRGELFNKIVSTSDKSKHVHAYMEYRKGCFYAKHGSGSFNSTKPSAALATGGRIVIDFDAAIENGHFLSIGRDDMLDGIRLKLKEYKTNIQAGQNKDDGSSSDMILFHQIPQEYRALMWPTMPGFSFTSKSWGDVVIDGLSEITFDPSVFDCLVLPETRKRMIKALVKHTSLEGGFHDLVKGKGEGTAFLLYGEPGTGKTLTAEALAELLGRPLYSISMGTLGTTADELERRLGEILHLSERWNALLLLDEADSFLESRSSDSPLERNAMVSVMLRLVEYHQGILFLTSNRVDSLDPAFKTRITLALHYEPLDADGRVKVWENLLVKSGYRTVLKELNLKSLAEWPLNGREIKNALRLAMALAADDDCALTQELLVDAAKVLNGQNESMKNDCIENVDKTKGKRRWKWRSKKQ